MWNSILTTRMRRLFEMSRSWHWWPFNAWFDALNEKSVSGAEGLGRQNHIKRPIVQNKNKGMFPRSTSGLSKTNCSFVALCFSKPGGKMRYNGCFCWMGEFDTQISSLGYLWTFLRCWWKLHETWVNIPEIIIQEGQKVADGQNGLNTNTAATLISPR